MRRGMGITLTLAVAIVVRGAAEAVIYHVW